MSPNTNPVIWFGRSLRFMLLWLLTLATAAYISAGEDNGTWKFVIIGDHRGDNDPGLQSDGSYSKLVLDPATGKYIGFKDGGINQTALAQLAAAAKAEGAVFVLEIGDLATKYLPQINGRTADELMGEELAHWKQIWNDNSGSLPIFPVRGNQEYTASEDLWLSFISGMPGIGTLPRNGPPGEEGLTYAFKYKNCLFLGIDQYVSPDANGDSHVITPAAQAWLEQVLAASDRPFKFVYGHAPAFEIWNTKKKPFTTLKDGLANPYTLFTPASLAARDAFWTAVGSAGAEYFCGHEHIYARGITDVNGRAARQTVVGNGGAPPSPVFPADYTAGPFAESYVGIPLPSNPAGRVLTAPLIISETTPRGGGATMADAEIGYVVVSVHGSHVTATYKSINGSYQESWTVAGTPE